MREVTLKSGRVLKVSPAPFSDAKSLYQSIAGEIRGVDLRVGILGVYKDMLCSIISSKPVEESLWKCMGRCIYDGVKITPDVFEDNEKRGDYYEIVSEVVKENTDPFVKSLFAQFPTLKGIVEESASQVSPSVQTEKTS